jgi:hypothetical protein
MFGMRLPQFTTKTLILITTVAAICWSYCYGMSGPQQLANQEQHDFEAKVRRLIIGNYYGYDYFPDPLSTWMSQGKDDGTLGHIVYRSWPNATYCLYRVTGGSGGASGQAWTFELYRLPPVSVEDVSEFLNFLNGHRKTKPAFKYELIYSAPAK